ncbi:MAG: glutamate synthase large subunit [Alphaproteobacteria bacterium]
MNKQIQHKNYDAGVQNWIDQSEYLSKHGLYVPELESSACGVGMIAATDGKPTRLLVERALEALKALWHRGAVDADGKTGDGAGIHVQIPHNFFIEHIERTGHAVRSGQLAVGMIFLPRTDLSRQERVRTIIESEILNLGHVIYGWRQVPVNIKSIGPKANATRPEIEQIMIENAKGSDLAKFETDLYIIRRRIEKALLDENLTDAYICSFSCRSIIYKGLFLAEQLDSFYPDLADPSFESNFAIYHQRYSTNTFPSWSLAQPFRVLAHNGEINTITGNVNWMRSHEARLDEPDLTPHLDAIRPVIPSGSSDSSALDAVFEILLRTHRGLPEVKSLLIPEAWAQSKTVPEKHKDFYRYANAIMEAWDGPAAICAYGGRWALAGTDRNGLRPLRFIRTNDNMLVVGSEVGMVRVPDQDILEKGRIGPGQMIGVDLHEGKLYYDQSLKDIVANLHPFGEWVKNVTKLESLPEFGAGQEDQSWSKQEITSRMVQAGWSHEAVELILRPMAEDGKEAIGSMGDDTPLAILSTHYRGLHHYFRQNFAQVTNPPIDSLRERYVMSLVTRMGNLGNILDEQQDQLSILKLESPILLNGDLKAISKRLKDTTITLDCSFKLQDQADANAGALKAALDQLVRDAEDAVRQGARQLILSDEQSGQDRAIIPMILATGAVHSWLIKAELRSFVSLTVRSSEVYETQAVAVLIGVGATTVNPYMAQLMIQDLYHRGLCGNDGVEHALMRFKTSLEDGLLKIMSKMGISVVSSYRGSYNFEAVGLSRALVNEYFPGLVSRISGIGVSGLQAKIIDQHRVAWLSNGSSNGVTNLPVGGFYRYRRGQEAHGWEGKLIHLLQSAVGADSYTAYKQFSTQNHQMAPTSIRDLLDFSYQGEPVNLDEVESITALRKRLVAPGISLGALSPIAHETLAIAMNRIGAKSDSGEGGEDPARFSPRENGDNPSSAIKQVASGRFGVTAEYLNQCKEIEIKVAQGAKPGEGGQLPGIKVSGLIARLRHSTEGVTLISPPPHHDIYSIEDLAQLIYDLKQINPDVRVCVKLVARSGIGTVASGVAKAKADVIMISGHSGGTGASPQSSIKYAGLPWEMGVAEVHQVLTLNGLRNRVILRTDGGLKTGRDVVIAAILGAEEFGIGTASLVAMGCIMVRQCHSNTCPVGVCTQDPKLIERFGGTAEKVVRLFSFIAEEVREILASLGVKSLNEVIGRTELLTQLKRSTPQFDDIDLNPLLVKAGGDTDLPSHATLEGRNEVEDSLDKQMVEDAAALFKAREKIQLQYNIRNTDRAIGTRLSSYITRQFGMKGLQHGHVHVWMRGSAGQSLGAFAVQGLKLEILGDANDYVGKGLCGGQIILRPPVASQLVTKNNAIIGNTCLYGATQGSLYAAGMAGNRFAVRNSGAISVVEGIGANGCEYMTGGEVIILGEIGDNFAAGMTGGMAFIYDPDRRIHDYLNPETVGVYSLSSGHWADHLYQRIAMHFELTHSKWAEELLQSFETTSKDFLHIVPHEILAKLEVPLSQQAA